MSERKIWMRFLMPMETHAGLKRIAERNKRSLADTALELVTDAVNEDKEVPIMVKHLIGNLLPDVSKVGVAREYPYWLIEWEKEEVQSKILYDIRTQEIFQRQQASPDKYNI